ncbi:hypothetical protein [Citricoccus sp. I39-566]|uniref:hypothetical protein n=1 Tax=Citricoccus sp. I39-566 TaxID=3073268 RepID=UPI00286A9735|nr:hypothetical protein [Citricoccus sp. I39-566]WMY79115.1 hypothetical protein RE421_04395 [Citricoccus sp. I39-566]
MTSTRPNCDQLDVEALFGDPEFAHVLARGHPGPAQYRARGRFDDVHGIRRTLGPDRAPD